MSEARTSPAPRARYAVPVLLELRGVSKVYGNGAAEVHALRQAGLSVQAGSMVAVMGPSGSEYIVGHPGVWLATSDEIADHYARTRPPA